MNRELPSRILRMLSVPHDHKETTTGQVGFKSVEGASFFCELSWVKQYAENGKGAM